MDVELKPLQFVGSAQDDLRSFPRLIRQAIGIELMRVQAGVDPVDFKPLRAVGRGVHEIRVHVQGAWRVIYVARMKEAIYVLHAFQKKTRKTARHDIELAAKRYKLIGD